MSVISFHLLALMHYQKMYVLTRVFFFFFFAHVVAPPLIHPTPFLCLYLVIKGGSWISTGAESSRFARFAFRRHFIQHEGFRMVRSANPTPVRLCDAKVFVLGAGVSGK